MKQTNPEGLTKTLGPMHDQLTLTPNNPGELWVNPDNLRDSKLYRELSPVLAVELIENDSTERPDDIAPLLTAWQYVADTGLWKSLQGFYGRTVLTLVRSGKIQPPDGMTAERFEASF